MNISRKGKLTAWALFMIRRRQKKPFNWTAFCTVVDYCTSPCSDCASECRSFYTSFGNETLRPGEKPPC